MDSILADNTLVDYPLLSSDNLDTDLIQDISIVWSGNREDINITVFVLKPGFCYIAIEDAKLIKGICYFYIKNPKPYTIYRGLPIDKDSKDKSFWIVLGPGIENKQVNLPNLREPLTASVIAINKAVTNMNAMVVNGKNIPTVGDLKLLADSLYVSISVIDNNIILSRNDEEIPLDILERGFIQTGVTVGDQVYSINGIPPDRNGNFSISFQEVKEEEEGTKVYTYIKDLKNRCKYPVDGAWNIKHGKCEAGIAEGLPLDSFVEGVKEIFKREDCGCDD